MRIVFFSPDVYSVFFQDTKFIFGGVETEICITAEGLAKIPDNEVIAVTRDQGFKTEVCKGVKIVPYPLLKGEGYWQKRKTIAGKIAHRLKPEKSITTDSFFDELKPDVIYIMGLCPHILEIARYCRKNNVRFIFKAAHDMDFGGETNDKAAFEKWACRPLKEMQELYELVDLFLVQTPFQQKILRQHFGKDAEIILNPLVLHDVSPAEKKYDLLWVGKNNHFKRPELLRSVAELLPQNSFCMICNNFDPASWEQLKASLPQNVELIESVPADKMTDYYNASRIFLSTSVYEGFPNTFLQAASCKVPVISMCSNPNGMLTVYNAGMLTGENVETCVNAIKELSGDEKKYKTMSEAAFAYVLQFHESGKIISRVNEILHNEKVRA
jgi:glycosyltransferase involved in cell wall biosynthesis